MSAFEWFDMDRIGVKIVSDKDVFVASTTLNRKTPSKLEYNFQVGSLLQMVLAYRACVLSLFFSGDGICIVCWSSSLRFVDFMFFHCWSKCPSIVASDFGRYRWIALTVAPGHVLKWPFFNSLDPCSGSGGESTLVKIFFVIL